MSAQNLWNSAHSWPHWLVMPVTTNSSCSYYLGPMYCLVLEEQKEISLNQTHSTQIKPKNYPKTKQIRTEKQKKNEKQTAGAIAAATRRCRRPRSASPWSKNKDSGRPHWKESRSIHAWWGVTGRSKIPLFTISLSRSHVHYATKLHTQFLHTPPNSYFVSSSTCHNHGCNRWSWLIRKEENFEEKINLIVGREVHKTSCILFYYEVDGFSSKYYYRPF